MAEAASSSMKLVCFDHLISFGPFNSVASCLDRYRLNHISMDVLIVEWEAYFVAGYQEILTAPKPEGTSDILERK